MKQVIGLLGGYIIVGTLTFIFIPPIFWAMKHGFHYIDPYAQGWFDFWR